MYGRYSEDLGQYAKSQAKRIRAMKRNEELLLENQSGFKKYGKSAWKRTLVSKFNLEKINKGAGGDDLIKNFF